MRLKFTFLRDIKDMLLGFYSVHQNCRWLEVKPKWYPQVLLCIFFSTSIQQRTLYFFEHLSAFSHNPLSYPAAPFFNPLLLFIKALPLRNKNQSFSRPKPKLFYDIREKNFFTSLVPDVLLFWHSCARFFAHLSHWYKSFQKFP